MTLFGFLKIATITPLQEQVVRLGICPNCHGHTLQPRHVDCGLQWDQCSKCLHVYATRLVLQ